MSVFSKRPKVKFNVKTVFDGHFKITYRGIEAVKCPFDYVLYQMLIWEIKPDLIIEIGTNKGGSALYFADILNMLGGKREVHTIDIVKDLIDPSIANNTLIKTFTDGYQNYNLELAKGFEKILIIEDGSHTYEDTIAAMKKFASLVTPGSYMIIEDGIIDELGLKKAHNGGPLKAIAEFMDTSTDFVIDRKWCDMFGTNATFNVNGYLKRI